MKKIRAIVLLASLSLSVFSQGYYAEYSLSSTTDTSIRGKMVMFYQGGNSRSEINMKQSGAEVKLVYLALNHNSSIVYMLDERVKKYSEILTATSDEWRDYPQSDYEVTVEGKGKDKANGYKCTRVIVKRKHSDSVEELWLTKEIENYADMMKMKSRFTGKENLIKALTAADALGFPVRMKTSDHKNVFLLDLAKVEARDNPSSLFSLNGYAKGGSMAGNPAMSEDLKKMTDGIENMTPEERKRVAEEVKKKLGKD